MDRRDRSGYLRHSALNVELRLRLRFVTRPFILLESLDPLALLGIEAHQTAMPFLVQGIEREQTFGGHHTRIQIVGFPLMCQHLFKRAAREIATVPASARPVV